MRSNRAVKTQVPKASTYEGAPAFVPRAEFQLRRVVMANMLFEDTFYCDGEEAAAVIKRVLPSVKAGKVMQMAIEAREKMKLRHVPLLIAKTMLTASEEHRLLVAGTLERIIQRPDELGEFLAIYYKDQSKDAPLAAQAKKGLARAITKFDEYQLQKWDRDAEYKLRDVIFLTHPKPKNTEQARLWTKLVNKTYIPKEMQKKLHLKKDHVALKQAETWETKMSAGEDAKTEKEKKKIFTQLAKEQKMGAMAVLMNLRNMIQNKVEPAVIKKAILEMKTDRVLPFRFITAARYAPDYEPEIEQSMMRCLEGQKKFDGVTVLLVDVSGSMDDRLSSKGETTRMDAASGLAILLREVCEDVRIFTFSNNAVKIPGRRGFALRDAITSSQPHGGTMTGAAIGHINNVLGYDRIIVITDEQSHDSVPKPDKNAKGYFINVAPYQNGVGYGAWNHIDGWSEAVIDYIHALEEDKE
jgi:60 kDa SS-A/Ro ribonucleoprotein